MALPKRGQITRFKSLNGEFRYEFSYFAKVLKKFHDYGVRSYANIGTDESNNIKLLLLNF